MAGLQIKVKDSEIEKGQIALISEEKLPLTVIDDFVVRSIGKKGMFSKKNNGWNEQIISSNLPISDSESRLFNSQSQKGKGPDAESLEFNELPNSSTPEPDPIYQTTTLPPAELVLYYHHDHLGNIRAVTDQNGNVAERHDFYPFGEEMGAPLNKDQYLFTGKERDSETGLDYFGARYYSPSLCRFLSIDPSPGYIADTRTLNPYIYAANNPLVYIDRDGEAVVIVAVAIGAGIGGLITGTAEALTEYMANPNASFKDLAKAFGAGFAGGAAGAVAGAIVGSWTKNPMITVPVGQAVQSGVTKLLKGDTKSIGEFFAEVGLETATAVVGGKVVKILGPRAPGRPIDVWKIRKFKNLKELWEFLQKSGTGLYMRKVGFESFITSLPFMGELHWAIRDWNRFIWHLRIWQAMKKPLRPTVTVEWEYNWGEMLYGRANPVPPSQRR